MSTDDVRMSRLERDLDSALRQIDELEERIIALEAGAR